MRVSRVSDRFWNSSVSWVSLNRLKPARLYSTSLQQRKLLRSGVSTSQALSFPSIQECCSRRGNGFVHNSIMREEMLGVAGAAVVKRALTMASSSPLRSWSVMLPEVMESEKFGAVKSWCKAEGELVHSGEQLCEIEISDCTFSIQADTEGYIAMILVPEGQEQVPVGTPLCVLVKNEVDIALLRMEHAKKADTAKYAFRQKDIMRVISTLLHNGRLNADFASLLLSLVRSNSEELFEAFNGSFEGDVYDEDAVDVDLFLLQAQDIAKTTFALKERPAVRWSCLPSTPIRRPSREGALIIKVWNDALRGVSVDSSPFLITQDWFSTKGDGMLRRSSSKWRNALLRINRPLFGCFCGHSIAEVGYLARRLSHFTANGSEKGAEEGKKSEEHPDWLIEQLKGEGSSIRHRRGDSNPSGINEGRIGGWSTSEGNYAVDRNEYSTPSPPPEIEKPFDMEDPCHLSATRKVGISIYEDVVLVDIRQWMKIDGNLRPMKKGISLTIPQWERLKQAAPLIDKEVKLLQGTEGEEPELTTRPSDTIPF